MLAFPLWNALSVGIRGRSLVLVFLLHLCNANHSSTGKFPANLSLRIARSPKGSKRFITLINLSLKVHNPTK
ncbi:MAG: hypothetical protein K6T90_15130 [Leptolyngbyaceae cyanobacterium HOT.MB2.61]|nr:hypothetical protein [Leptolyngbyaceae cyanobacterium HOT.MB2.61]